MAANVTFPFIRRTSVFLLLISTLVVNSLAGINPANAATNNLNISVTDTKVTFDPATNGYSVSVTGEVANDSTNGISQVTVTLGTKSKLSTRDALQTFLADRTKAKLTSTSYSTKIEKLKANSVASWQLTFNAHDLFVNPNGIYGFGVTATADKLSSTDVFAASLLPESATKLGSVLAVQLTTLNAHLANGGKTAADGQEVTRLTNIITDSSELEVSWLVDPALVQWLTDLQKTDLADQASNLLGLLDAISAKSTSTIYGQPDVARLIASNRNDDLINLVERTREISKRPQVVYVPKSGTTSNAAITKLGDMAVKPVLTNVVLTGKNNKSVPAFTNIKATPGLVSDAGLATCLSKDSPNAITMFRERNCLQNNLALIAVEQSPNVMLLTPFDWSPNKDVLPYLVQSVSESKQAALRPLTELILSQPSGQQKMPADIKVSSFDHQIIKAGDNISLSAGKISSLFADGNYADAFTLARLRGFSSLWPTGDVATEFLKSNEELLVSYQNEVAIDASRSITVSNSSTQVPVTVVNNSDHDVAVVVHLTSPMGSRFSSEPSSVISVPSGKRVTVPMSITLTGKGILNVTATLTTPNGQTVGKPKLIQISSAEYQGFARTLVLVAFGLLILLSISNLVKRKKRI